MRKPIFSSTMFCLLGAFLLSLPPGATATDDAPTPNQPPSFGGVYPHLAMFSNNPECGVGAVVPWADRLWVITYGPHFPLGSSDKLYEIDGDLGQTIRPESVGGTPAGRMIHRESNQLFIGPYAIDAQRQVRVIPPDVMPGRLTGIARHLFEPERKIYYASMEEGFYEVDTQTLEVTLLYEDGNIMGDRANPLLPGYHGKGLYTGQGRLVYANNGEDSALARQRPDIESGCLAEWDGETWRVVRRNQFTEVSGPDGIYGGADPDNDPIWSIGWDHRSLILMALDGGEWAAWRLPKGSHSYDGAHGWNTEWPRIREIGESDLMMIMHGLFWRFPADFSHRQSAGVAPRSAYLRILGDFARWGDRIVLGCNDGAMSAFLNRPAWKNEHTAPERSQSNLWFIAPEELDRMGPAIARGALWIDDPVVADQPSEPFLFAGFDRRMLHLTHKGPQALSFRLEVDRQGNGVWAPMGQMEVEAEGYAWKRFTPDEQGAWLRLVPLSDGQGVTAMFAFSNSDHRPSEPDARFRSLARRDDETRSGGILKAGGGDDPPLRMLATSATGEEGQSLGYYEMQGNLALHKVDNAEALEDLQKAGPLEGFLTADAASVIFSEEPDGQERRYRLPRGDTDARQTSPLGRARANREVVTERDLFHAFGIFYELPAANAGGFPHIRAVATHPFDIVDYCSWRGVLALSGVKTPADDEDERVIVSEDGKCALWLGVVDDLWALGKARGVGGPWKDTPVEAGQWSDPYLMTGFDRKTLFLSHGADGNRPFTVEVDLTGTGIWRRYGVWDVEPGETVEHTFPEGYCASWLRVSLSADAVATAQLRYE